MCFRTSSLHVKKTLIEWKQCLFYDDDEDNLITWIIYGKIQFHAIMQTPLTPQQTHPINKSRIMMA